MAGRARGPTAASMRGRGAAGARVPATAPHRAVLTRHARHPPARRATPPPRTVTPDRGPVGAAAEWIATGLEAAGLGALLEHLARRGPDVGRRRALRVTLGTGFCGGFTTYSALANDTDGLLRSGLVGHALAYAVGTLVLGLAAGALGILVARRRPASSGGTA